MGDNLLHYFSLALCNYSSMQLPVLVLTLDNQSVPSWAQSSQQHLPEAEQWHTISHRPFYLPEPGHLHSLPGQPQTQELPWAGERATQLAEDQTGPFTRT